MFSRIYAAMLWCPQVGYPNFYLIFSKILLHTENGFFLQLWLHKETYYNGSSSP